MASLKINHSFCSLTICLAIYLYIFHQSLFTCIFFPHPVCHISLFNQASFFLLSILQNAGKKLWEGICGSLCLSPCLSVHLSVYPSSGSSPKPEGNQTNRFGRGSEHGKEKLAKEKNSNLSIFFSTKNSEIHLGFEDKNQENLPNAFLWDKQQNSIVSWHTASSSILKPSWFTLTGLRAGLILQRHCLGCFPSLIHMSHSVHCTHFCDP